MVTILLFLLPSIEKKTCFKLIPYYSYARIYKDGDILKKHTDRFSCEISTTLSIGGASWPIFLKTLDKKEIKDKGFCILEDFLNNKDLDKIKNSLLKALHYIQSDDEKDLQKKYYKIKKYNPKLKGNWYDIAGRDINLLQFLHQNKNKNNHQM